MKKILSALMTLCILLMLVGCTDVEALGEPKSKYLVDVVVFQLEATTKVDIYKEDDLLYSIKGKFWTFILDPLNVFDSNGNIVGQITDEFNLFRQDDHNIIVDNVVMVTMEGQYQFAGEKYILKKNDEVIGTADFDFVNWTGKITSSDGNVIASYKRVGMEQDFLLKDFEVRIYDDEILTDLEVLMIIAAYHSDRMADERASNNSSSSSNNSSY